TVVWSTIGNHETSMQVYMNIFSFPKNGEAGGVPSGVENYYSFNYGDIHFVCLAGYYSGSLLSNGVMCTWLKADLEANTNKWLIAFWHQPPYTKGSHDSDYEGDLIQMRQNAVPILESYGVDLVLCGHSHVYERSYLLHGHYGYSWDLDPQMILNGGSGRTDDAGAYVKHTSGPNADQGTVYIVNGSSAWVAGCCRGTHPAHYRSLPQIGSVVLDIDGDTLQGTFLNGDGVIEDYFTILKDGTIVQIVNIRVEGSNTTLSWTSRPDRHYRVEFTTNLGVGWTPVGDLIEADGTLTTASHSNGGALQGFYRVIQTD
ncbi:MAG TPA: metallophosphoesterase, partial [Verrucomicrobiae bacterium]|nr:metallophosphoesterase [Verrucomicrobiae bacterium]